MRDDLNKLEKMLMQSLSQIPMSYKEALENLEESKVREALKNLRNSCKTVVQLFLILLLLSLRWKSLPVSSARTLLLLPYDISAIMNLSAVYSCSTHHITVSVYYITVTPARSFPFQITIK